MRFVRGDATSPVGPEDKIIVHCCNDIGVWGAGFVLAISKRWPGVAKKYQKYIKAGGGLGSVQLVKVEPDIYIANLIGQRGVGFSADGKPPVRYEALALGLDTVAEYAKVLNATVHMPRMGCGLAGGEWARVEEIVREALKGVDTTVYDWEE